METFDIVTDEKSASNLTGFGSGDYGLNVNNRQVFCKMFRCIVEHASYGIVSPSHYPFHTVNGAEEVTFVYTFISAGTDKYIFVIVVVGILRELLTIQESDDLEPYITVQKRIDTLKKRILIADDEQQILDMIQDMLNLEFEVYTAKNGSQVLKLMNRTDIDLLITDIFMPEKDGLEVIKAVAEKHPSVKIIAISGLGQQMGAYILKAADMLGASACLNKPFTKDELMSSINKVLS